MNPRSNKIPIVILSFLFYRHFVFSQNLVPNPSFEEFNPIMKCRDYAKSSSGFEKRRTYNFVKNWRLTFSADYWHNKCEKTEYFETRTGNAAIGMVIGLEYVGVKIKEKLIKDKWYEISFYLKLSDRLTNTSKYTRFDSITVFDSVNVFLTRSGRNLRKGKFYNEICIRNYKGAPTLVTSTEKKVSAVHSQWREFIGYYKASGDEKYFMLPFTTDRNCNKTAGYYFLDDVSIVQKEKGQETTKDFTAGKNPREKDWEIAPGNSQILKGVLFKKESDKLKENTCWELNRIAGNITYYPEISIEIKVFVSEKNLTIENKKLATDRAKAIAEYFFLKGVPLKKLTYYGFNEKEKTEQLGPIAQETIIEIIYK